MIESARRPRAGKQLHTWGHTARQTHFLLRRLTASCPLSLMWALSRPWQTERQADCLHHLEIMESACCLSAGQRCVVDACAVDLQGMPPRASFDVPRLGNGLYIQRHSRGTLSAEFWRQETDGIHLFAAVFHVEISSSGALVLLSSDDCGDILFDLDYQRRRTGELNKRVSLPAQQLKESLMMRHTGYNFSVIKISKRD